MIPAWLAANGTRILVYGALALFVAAFFELDGYRRGELGRFEDQAKQASARVAMIVRRVEVTREVDDAATRDLAGANERLRLQLDALRRGPRLSSAAAIFPACPPLTPGVQGAIVSEGGGGTAGDRVPDARRVLDDVEDAVFAILTAGDLEIAKGRGLYARDLELARRTR